MLGCLHVASGLVEVAQIGVRIDEVWIEHQRHLIRLHGLLGLALQHVAAGEIVVAIGEARLQGDSLCKY